MNNRGVLYMAYGAPARAEAEKSMRSLHRHNDLPTFIVNEVVCQNVHGVPKEGYYAGRRAFLPGRVKPNFAKLTPFDMTLYLDADTRVMGDLTPIFSLLEIGYEMVFTEGQAARFVAETQFARMQTPFSEHGAKNGRGLGIGMNKWHY